MRDRQSNMPKTTKGSAEEHGIGLRNTKETIEKHGGLFRIDVKDGTFMAEVMLKIC